MKQCSPYPPIPTNTYYALNHSENKMQCCWLLKFYFKSYAYLEKIILVDNATVWKGFDKSIGQSGFSTIGHAR